VIHRDLKPSNVMLAKGGAKLLDFGLAKMEGHPVRTPAGHLVSAPTQPAPLTFEGVILGTLEYMAPEQLEGHEADARTDLWALGVILYEMLAGRRAFAGASAAGIISAIMSLQPPALSSVVPSTPPLLDRLVRTCLSKERDDRWDSAHDVAQQLWALSAAAETGGGGRGRAVSRAWPHGPRGRAQASVPGRPGGALRAVIARSRLTMKNDVSYLAFKSSDEVVRAVGEIARHFPRDSDDVFHVNQGGGEIVIICDADHEPLVASVRGQAIEDLKPVGVLRIRETQDDNVPVGAEVPGLYAYFLGRLAANGINLLDVISTTTQLTLVLAERDLTAAFALIGDGIRECRSHAGL
jgi:hypothetical protein